MDNLWKKNIAIIFGIALIMLVIPITAYVLTHPTNFPGIAGTNLPGFNAPKPEFVPKATTTNTWPTYTSKQFGYSVSYPTEFTVDQRGKVGKIDDLVAFTYNDKGKSITVAKVQIQSGTAPTGKSPTSQQGKDGDGNEVLVYTYPYPGGKTLTLLGTVYPTVGGNFRFASAITQMSQTLTIK